MPFVNPLAATPERLSSRHFSEVLVFFAVLFAGNSFVWAQSGGGAGQAVVAPTAKPSAPVSVATHAGPSWQELSNTQRKILLPLAGTWISLSASHKNKWIALAQTYPSKGPADQQKMQSRMVEWAALTPSERERARLNFAESKKLSPSERAAEWETYQGLSTQDKERLASRGPGKPAGAAVAVTPVPPSKLIAVPVTRRTPLETSSTAASRPRINPKTLLPTPAPSPAPVAPALRTPAAPASVPSSPDALPGAPQPGASAPN